MRKPWKRAYSSNVEGCIQNRLGVPVDLTSTITICHSRESSLKCVKAHYELCLCHPYELRALSAFVLDRTVYL
jgi:hypothetical protein